MVVLSKKLGTRYMIESLDTLLEKVVLSIPEGEVADIAHLSFTPITMKKLLSTMSIAKCKLVDTFDKDRNAILEENYRRLAMRDELEIIDISDYNLKPDTIKDVAHYMNSMESGKTYKILSQQSLELDVPIVVLLMLLRPSVNIDMGLYAVNVFKYISEIMYTQSRKIIQTTDEYLMLYRVTNRESYIRAVTITEKDINAKFDLYPLKNTSWQEILDVTDDCYILPKYLGEEPIMKNPELAPIFKKLQDRAQLDISRYFRMKQKSLFTTIQ